MILKKGQNSWKKFYAIDKMLTSMKFHLYLEFALVYFCDKVKIMQPEDCRNIDASKKFAFFVRFCIYTVFLFVIILDEERDEDSLELKKAGEEESHI